MDITLTFKGNLNDDAEQIEELLHGRDYKTVLISIESYLRHREETDETATEIYSSIRERLEELLKEYNVTLDC